MEKSTNYNFNLPNSANDEIADINDISDNFRIIDEIMKETDQTYSPTSANAQSGKAVAEAVSTEQKRADNTFANALKGSKSGAAILIDDISPVAHEMGVKLSSDTITDFSGVTVTRCGKNLFDGNIQVGYGLTGTGNNRTVTSDNSGYKIIRAKPNTKYCFSGDFSAAKDNVIRFATFTEYPTENSVSNKFDYTSGISHVFTTTDNDNYLFIWIILPQKTTDIAMQIEEGATATEYEQYNGQTVIANADGTVEGVTSLYPNTTLTTDTNGVLIDCEYNRDINKAFAELKAAIISSGGTI